MNERKFVTVDCMSSVSKFIFIKENKISKTGVNLVLDNINIYYDGKCFISGDLKFEKKKKNDILYVSGLRCIV